MGAPAHGEILAYWNLDRLVPRSDLIVLGTQTSPRLLRIDRVLKGIWPGQTIEIPSLSGFGYENVPAADGKAAQPFVGNRCVVFVTLRGGPASVVANGVYREREDGRYADYRQSRNPGPYVLQALQAKYESLEDLLREIARAFALIPAQQLRLIEEIDRAKPLNHQKLHDLEQITCLGDRMVFAYAAERLRRGGSDRRSFAYFFQCLRDPEVFSILKEEFERSRDSELLEIIGRQGTPAARQFFEQLICAPDKQELRERAFWSLSTLYETLTEAGNAKECARVRVTIFKVFDEYPIVARHVASNPQLLARIAHRGAVERLEKLLAGVTGDRSNREHRIRSCLEECRRRVESGNE